MWWEQAAHLNNAEVAAYIMVALFVGFFIGFWVRGE